MKEKEILRCIVILRKVLSDLVEFVSPKDLISIQLILNLLLKVISALESEVDV